MRSVVMLAALSMTSAGLAVASTAAAQDGDGYEAAGLRAGSFLVYPRVALDFEATDNVFASPGVEQSDTLWRVRPEVSIESGWSRHALNAYVRGAFTRYNDFTNEDTDVFGSGLAVRLDPSRFTSVDFGVDYTDGFEPRTSPGSPGANVEPIGYGQTQLFASFVHQVNRISLSSRYDYRDFDYDDGFTLANARIDQDFRDRNVSSLTGRVAYEISPATKWFVQGTVNQREYESGSVRDSDGSELLAGIAFEVTRVIEGEISAGYISQEFDNPAFGSVDGFSVRAQVDWTPTGLTTVSATAARTVEDSPLAGTAGYLSTSTGLSIQHELRRNIILNARVGAAFDEYESIDRDDKTFSAGVGASWLVNRSAGVTAAYSYQDRSSEGAARGDEFSDNRFTVTLVLQR